MNIAHVNIKGGQNTHCFFDGVWNIVKFKIKENLVSTPFKLANDIRAFGIKEFHTDFNKGFLSVNEERKSSTSVFSAKSQAMITSLPIMCSSDDIFKFIYSVFFIVDGSSRIISRHI